MKLKLNRRVFTFSLLILTIVVFSNLISCDYITENNKAKIEKEHQKEEVVTNMNEAKILVQASEYNLDVIELCEIIKRETKEDSIREMLNGIQNEQEKIFEKYKEVASNNIITLPRFSELATTVEGDVSTDEDLKAYLNLMNSKIYHQRDLIKRLSDTTDNSSFKTLADYASESLRNSLKKTNETLQELEKDT
ncbi:hypothetical protein [Kordia zhangzhouensis]|uniref:hypothetical protein n=1 Tax=Kordia zhangzhouensis TaxID=1620405 RepID=UPI0012E028AF|nr:hypothetical protein [Kordia zhangzhouensis]